MQIGYKARYARVKSYIFLEKTMDQWLHKACQRGCVARVESSATQNCTSYCHVAESPWYDGGVVFDWTRLHGMLKSGVSADAKCAGRKASQSNLAESAIQLPCRSQLAAQCAALHDFGVQQLIELGSDNCLMTVIELLTPWELQPLSEQAQSLSKFVAPATHVEPASFHAHSQSSAQHEQNRHVGNASSPHLHDSRAMRAEASERTWYTFTRGPPGQRSTVRDILTVLQSVEKQLGRAKMHSVEPQRGDVEGTKLQQHRHVGYDDTPRVRHCLGSFVIFGCNFSSMLHHTAAVHRALTTAGLMLDIQASSLIPRRVLWCICEREGGGADRKGWHALPPSALTSDEDVAQYVVDLLFQWLQDDHVWGCEAPLHVSQTTECSSSSSISTTIVKDMSEHARRLLVAFIEKVVAPSASRCGLQSIVRKVRASLACTRGTEKSSNEVDKNGDANSARLKECLAKEIECKRVRVGVQKWTIVDLRLTLHQLGAYSVDPKSIFCI